MVALGIGLVVLGIILLVAEAHVPGGLLGVLGAALLVGGLLLAVTASGGALALAVPVAAGAGAAAAGFGALAAHKAALSRRARIRSGAEALSGHVGVARSWEGAAGQVFVDGALWRARRAWHEDDEPLNPGDPVIIETVRGLTLSVRRAEEWEVHQ